MTAPLATPAARYGVAGATVLAALLAIHAAVGWYGHPVAGFLVDPGGIVSNFGGGDAERRGLRFPDQIVSVDGQDLRWGSGETPGQTWDRRIVAAAREGRDAIDVVAQTSTGVVRTRLRVQSLGALAWWTYAGSLLFAGILFVAAGFVAHATAPNRPLPRTFAKVGLFTGLLIALSFDFHTTHRLTPVFLTAFAMAPLSWVALALRLPDDAPILRRWPWLERALDATGAVVALAFIALCVRGQDIGDLQRAWSHAFRAAFPLFGVTFLVRFARSRGVARSRMRALLVSVVPPQLVTVGALAFPEVLPAGFGPVAQAASYGMLSLFPVATAYAFIRYDLWGSRALLSRILTRVAVGAIACGVAVGIGTAFAVQLGAPFQHALLASGFAATFAAILAVTALAGVDRFLFAARTRYKPTVEQLSEELTSITSPLEVARAMERTIRRWLPCEHVELCPSNPGEDDGAGGVRPSDAASSGDQRTLAVEFGGARLGTLTIGAKAGQALFTEDDMDLLRTIVNQGALALAHAFAYQELEKRRQEQAAAWRGERAALVETVAAEVAHEIRYPINFFKNFFSRKNDAPLDAEDLDIGREEVDRLERLVSGLRRMASRTLSPRRVPVAEICDRVEVLLRDALGNRRIERTDIEGAAISCDPDQITQIVVNLVANGLQAAGEAGSVGVTWGLHEDGATLAVWDTGPGFEGDPAALFAPWYTTKEKGSGLGLAIVHRLVRAHGWNITAGRKENRTSFVIDIRASDVLRGANVTELGYSERSSEGPHRRRSA